MGLDAVVEPGELDGAGRRDDAMDRLVQDRVERPAVSLEVAANVQADLDCGLIGRDHIAGRVRDEHSGR